MINQVQLSINRMLSKQIVLTTKRLQAMREIPSLILNIMNNPGNQYGI